MLTVDSLSREKIYNNGKKNKELGNPLTNGNNFLL